MRLRLRWAEVDRLAARSHLTSFTALAFPTKFDIFLGAFVNLDFDNPNSFFWSVTIFYYQDSFSAVDENISSFTVSMI